MNSRHSRFTVVWRICLVIGLQALGVRLDLSAQQPAGDKSHDFDWELGVWETQVRRLARPLSGSTDWVEYRGRSVVRPVMGGKANLVELDVEGKAGRILGMALRLYNPAARQWSLNYSNSRVGTLSPPVVGAFQDGKGVFYGVDDVEGRVVLARFVITRPSADVAHFEQAFSGDGGATWEINWIADDRLIGPIKDE